MTYLVNFVGCLLICVVFSSFSVAQNQTTSKLDRWHGVILDQSTPDDALIALGKPVSDKVGNLDVDVIDRWISPKHKEKIFRKLTFKKINEVEKAELAFLNNKLVMINLNLGVYGENWSAKSLAGIFGHDFIPVNDVPKEAKPSDYENINSPRALKKFRSTYLMVAVSQNSFSYAMISVTDLKNSLKRLVFVPAKGPIPGKVFIMQIISRQLEKQ